MIHYHIQQISKRREEENHRRRIYGEYGSLPHKDSPITKGFIIFFLFLVFTTSSLLLLIIALLTWLFS